MNREQIQQLLEPALNQQLDQMVVANHCGAGSIVKNVSQSELRVRLDGVDRLACEVEMVDVSNPRAASMSTEQLTSLANVLSDQLSYLEERLVVLEIDSELADVQLRSQRPQQDAGVRSYFEVHVGQQGISVQRFSKQSGAARTHVAATLTRSVFVRLCVDLMSSFETN